MKFAAVGFTCVDIYKNLNISYATGNGVDVLFNLKEMMPEIEGTVVSAVGNDGYGKQIINACEIKGIDCSHITAVECGKTAVIEMLLNGRDRVHHQVERGVMSNYIPSDQDMEFIRNQDYIHTDLSWKVVDLLPDMRKNGAKIYFDFSKKSQHPDVEKVLKNINFGIFSFEEKTKEVEELLLWGCGLGAEVLIATFGEKGSLACDGKRFYEQPSIKVQEIVNTVGAGDAFGAGFLYATICNKDIQQRLLWGARKASEIVGIFEPYHINHI